MKRTSVLVMNPDDSLCQVKQLVVGLRDRSQRFRSVGPEINVKQTGKGNQKNFPFHFLLTVEKQGGTTASWYHLRKQFGGNIRIPAAHDSATTVLLFTAKHAQNTQRQRVSSSINCFLTTLSHVNDCRRETDGRLLQPWILES